MIEVYSVKLNWGYNESFINKLMSIVTEEKRTQIKKLRRVEDTQRCLIADVFARYLISKKTGIKNKHLLFEKNEFGKPFLKNLNNIQYNLSHSGNWIVCALDADPIGIDIEIIKPIDLCIAKRFFSSEEYIKIINKDENERLACFYEIWTMKESYIKAVGKGLSMSLNGFMIGTDNDNFIVESRNEKTKYFFYQYEIDLNYKLAVCSMRNEFPQYVLSIDTYEILSDLA